ncbi:MAG: glycogen/starch synthase [Desulfofustis sp.]|nr:glycogen/starch synthase [Desulfofustis sp.]
MLSREYGQLAGAGGVKDVVAQLSKALARWHGRKVKVVLPCYGFIDPLENGFESLADPQQPDRPLEFNVAMNYVGREREERVRVWHRVQEKISLYLLEAERFLEKRGVYTYTRHEHQRESWKIQGAGHFDYFAMSVLLQTAALDLMILLDERPQIVHCHDGHTAITPALMRECPGYRHYFRSSAAVVTIHNAGVGYHQEVSDLPFVQAVTGLPMRVILASCLEHSFDPFLAAGGYASISTVSDNYARELQESDSDYLTGWIGHRLLNSGITISGITNGIDPADFDPRRPGESGIAAGYDPADEEDDLTGKRVCKEALLGELAQPPAEDDEQRFGFIEGGAEHPLFTFIGRLSDQKGIDILIAAAHLFLAGDSPARFVCLGSGGEREEEVLSRMARDERYAGRLCFLRGFDPKLANRIYAAGDFFVIPSRYEPCGLTDYIAQLFGNLPVVHHVGGLVKVIDGETGFAYRDNTPEQCAEAMQRAQSAYTDRRLIRRLQKQAVDRIYRHHTWTEVMKDYLQLYRESRTGNLLQRRDRF